jgi:hypothetical protein
VSVICLGVWGGGKECAEDSWRTWTLMAQNPGRRCWWTSHKVIVALLLPPCRIVPVFQPGSLWLLELEVLPKLLAGSRRGCWPGMQERPWRELPMRSEQVGELHPTVLSGQPPDGFWCLTSVCWVQSAVSIWDLNQSAQLERMEAAVDL